NIESLDFPINEKLLEESANLKAERDLIKERIGKIEEKRSNVTPSVYQKVKSDYSVRLKEATDALLEKKTDIDRELSALYEARNKITGQLESHKQILEEAKFRNMLGEFDDKQFKDESTQASEKVKKFERVLAAVNNNVSRYEAIFGEENAILEEDIDFGLPAEGETGRATSPSISVTGQEEDEYLVGVETGDYFAAENEKTDRAPVNPIGQPKIEITSGDNKGEFFPVTNNMSIGRADANAITLKEAKVSRQHATIKEKAGGFVLLDLNSSNGVFVNGHRIKEHVLSDGDEIEIGDFKLKFSC
ncbi:FHA domain-containing protein, partial [bacterium]|nr:FHA domain-containing protein [bacterium]